MTDTSMPHQIVHTGRRRSHDDMKVFFLRCVGVEQTRETLTGSNDFLACKSRVRNFSSKVSLNGIETYSSRALPQKCALIRFANLPQLQRVGGNVLKGRILLVLDEFFEDADGLGIRIL